MTQSLRIGSVSYLNAKPLIWGLEANPIVDLVLDVPARLADGLREGRFDVALLPVIDYQRLSGLRLLPVGGIGCDGPTLTVRIYSARPIGRMRTLACDVESHTSVALARIVLAEQFGIHPQFVDLQGGPSPAADAVLLIGDKVVCEEPPGLEHQLDLGAAWKQLTGLPFVFAAWFAPEGTDATAIARLLADAQRNGLGAVDQIIQRHAIGRGWPAGVALQYLTVYLKYDVGPRQIEAMRRFFELAHRHGVLAEPPRPITVA
jgi:chorismate dehydratase